MPASPRRRAFGQHFLQDQHVISTLIETTFSEVARVRAKTLIEIGPGTGALTLPLLARIRKDTVVPRFEIIEKDRRLADHWMQETREKSGIRVQSRDFLDVPLPELVDEPPIVVISNLPYSAGTAILTKLAERPDAIHSMILMFQAEVAHRLRASPGEKAWGSLSIWMQNSWEISKLLSVPPGAFSPPPEVNSEVVLLRPRAKNLIPGSEGREKVLEKLLKVSFAHRRKMLRSGLPKSSVYLDALAKTSIDPTRRAESLNWAEWTQWFQALPLA